MEHQSVPIIQSTQEGKILSESPADWKSFQEKFRRQHCVRFPAFIGGELLRKIQDQVDRAEFLEAKYGTIGTELTMEYNGSLSLLQFLANDPTLFQSVDRITGCGRIGCFRGRVYRMIPASGHYDSWHRDVGRDRKLAMSVNLGRKPYQGGSLQIRDRVSKRVLHEVHNVGPGDAILFLIDDDLQHRITPLEGSVPKTAYAGWFCSVPEFKSVLKRGKRRLSRKQLGIQVQDLNIQAKIPRGVAYQRYEGKTAIIHPETGNISELDAVGSRLWNLLEETGALRKVFEVMSREYDVKPSVLEKDILQTIQELTEEGLLEIVRR